MGPARAAAEALWPIDWIRAHADVADLETWSDEEFHDALSGKAAKPAKASAEVKELSALLQDVLKKLGQPGETSPTEGHTRGRDAKAAETPAEGPVKEAAGNNSAPNGPDNESDQEGVSLLDAARILTAEDDKLAHEIVDRWQRLREPERPPSIGYCPRHRQRKLYAPSALCDFVEKVEDPSVCTQHDLRQRLLAMARTPREK